MAKKHKVKPWQVTSAQFWSSVPDSLTEWQVRKNGGLTNIVKSLYGNQEAIVDVASVPSKKIKKIKLVQPKLENFTVHRTDIKEVFKLCGVKQDGVLRVVVQPDTHCPHYDEAAVSAYCDFLSYYKPHGLVNLGDFLENESVAPWEPSSAKPRRFVPEIKNARELLGRIGEAAGPQCKYKRFLIGNHEYWLQQYLNLKIPEMFDDIEELGVALNVESLLQLKKFGYDVIPVNEILALGDLNFIHGYYTGTNHAKKHLDVFGVNIMYGHVHDVQSFSGVSVKGIHEAISIGCLRTLNAPFLKGKPTNWSHSFAIVEYKIDGTYTRYVPIMINGKFSFMGKIFGEK